MVPNVNRIEWEELLKGDEKVKSFAFQMKLNSLRLDLRLNKVKMQDAVKQLQEFCANNEKMFENDLKSIFRYTIS